MRIAVDARPLAHPFTGIGRYTESLLKRLVQKGHQWCLYSDRPITPRFPIGDRVQLRVGNASPGSALSLFYSQLAFPRWARGDCVDLFWSPRHHLPLWLPSSVAGVVTVHDLVWKRFPETMLERNRRVESMIMGPSLRRADKIICVSEFTASEVADVYPGVSDNCLIIPEAAEKEADSYEESFPMPDDPYLMFVGTLEPRKNLSRLLEAFAKACDAPDFRHQLLVVGAHGWGDDNLPDQVSQLGVANRVILKGRVSDAELRDLYSGTTALLMPSLYEGFGLPALEAMQYGVPVIAGDRGALPEVVGDGGVLVDPLNIAELCKEILRICRDRDYHRTISLAALARAAHYSWEESASLTLAAFETAYLSHSHSQRQLA